MPYDEDLAERIRAGLGGERGVTEVRMFGGLAFLLGGNLAVAASGNGGLLVRCDPAEADELVAVGPAEPAVMGGRLMSGWLRVPEAAVVDDAALARWVEVGRSRARALPPKSARRQGGSVGGVRRGGSRAW